MERTWYIIVDQRGKEIRTSSEKEARTAFRSGGIVTIIRENKMSIGDDMLVLTRVYIDMTE